MSYFLECLELAAIISAIICIIALIFTAIADAVDHHYSKKRGEI